MTPSGFQQDQHAKNLATANDWQSYQTHRQRVSRLLWADWEGLNAPPPAGRETVLAPNTLDSSRASLALLGAGNCNDLDLEKLLQSFQHLTLFDCDLPAMSAGIERQKQRIGDRVRLVEQDLTGCFSDFDQWPEAELGNAQRVLDCIESASPQRPEAAPFSRVASLCLWSQMVDRLRQYVEPRDSLFAECLASLRRLHLKTLLDWTEPGGVALLFLDVVSSDTAPQLRNCDPSGLPGLLGQLFQAGNFFAGLHPGQILKQIKEHPQLAEKVAQTQVVAPWIWEMGPRAFAVTCLCLRRFKEPA